MSDGRKHTSIPRGIAFLFVLAGCFSSHLSFSQKIGHVDFEVIGNTVQINYDIEGCSEDRSYDVRLLLGVDGKLAEIKRGISGDTENVACGSSKTISWDVLADREGLRGRIYFAVEILRTHYNSVPQSESKQQFEIVQKSTHANERKDRAMRSWKADKGYVGGSIGVFTPFESYSVVPYSLTKGGFFANATIGYLPTLLLGVSATVYVYSQALRNDFDIGSGKKYGFMVGPLISLPIGNRVKWELRPQLGYSAVTVGSDQSNSGSLNTMRKGVACSFGSGLRLNIGKRTCYMLNVEYLSAPIKFDDYPIEENLGSVGASFGVAFRFY